MMKAFKSLFSSQPSIKQEVGEEASVSVDDDVRASHEDEASGESEVQTSDELSATKERPEESVEGFGSQSESSAKKAKKEKKGKRKGRKARKSQDELELEGGDDEAMVNGGHDEEESSLMVVANGENAQAAPKGETHTEKTKRPRNSYGLQPVEGQTAEAFYAGLEENADDEDYNEKPKRSRKSNGSIRKRKRNTLDADSVLEPEAIDAAARAPTESNSAKTLISKMSRNAAVEENTQDAEAMEGVVGNGDNDSTQDIEPTRNPISNDGDDSTQDLQPTQDSVVDNGDDAFAADLTDLPKKVKRAKRKAREHEAIKQSFMAAEEDDNDSAAVLHKPLTPAHYYRTGSTRQEDSNIITGTGSPRKDPVAPEGAPDLTPIKPSKKALGKRRASESGTGASKKRKTQKDKTAGTPELTLFGFSSQPANGNSSIRPDSQRRPTPAFTPINGPKLTPKQDMVPTSAQKQPGRPEEPEEESEPLYVPKFRERRKKRRLPVGDDDDNEDEPWTPPLKTPQNQPLKSKTPSKAPKSAAKTPARTTTANGRLTSEEIEAISTAVEDYRVFHDLTQFEMNELIHKDAKSDGQTLWQHMYEEVPHLPRMKVIKACRRKFHNFEARGAWTEEQDQELREAYEKYPGKWKQIGQEMNRFADDCRDRWRNYLACGDNRKTNYWDKDEEQRLREVVQECMESVRELQLASDDQRVKDMSAESLVDWKVVSEKMDHTRSRLQCSNKWKLLKEREDAEVVDPLVAQPISETWRVEEAERDARKMKAKEKLLLLYSIRDSGAGREGKIPWKQVQEELPGKPVKMALRVAFRQMRQNIDDHQDMKLQDIVELLIDAFEAANPGEPAGFDNFEGFKAVKPAKKTPPQQKKRKSSDGAQVSDNGEGPSTVSKRKRQSKLSEEFVLSQDDEDDIYAVPQNEPPKSDRKKTASSLRAEDTPVDSSATKKKKKKLRDRMKHVGESQSQSQETNRRHSELSDLNAAFEAVKNGKSKVRRGASKNAATILSAERVVESDEEDSPGNEDLQPIEEDAVENEEVEVEKEQPPEDEDMEALEDELPENGDIESGTDEDGMYLDKIDAPEADADEMMDLDNHETYTAPGGPEAQDGDSPFQDEDENLDHAREESVDLDALRASTSSSFHDADEDEAEENGLHRKDTDEDGHPLHENETEAAESNSQLDGSVDLDARQRTASHNLAKARMDSSAMFDAERTPKVNGFTNTYAAAESDAVSSDDDDMDDIPAVPRKKLIEPKFAKKSVEPKKNKTKPKKRVVGF